MVAVLVNVPEIFTVATIDKVALAKLLKLPMVHTPVTLLYVPVDGVALTKVYPLGSISLRTTFVSLLTPKLVAVIVNVTLLPIAGVALLTVLTTRKSVQPLKTVVATD